jgi:transposase
LAKFDPMNRAILEASWGEFLRQLEYKCKWAGKPFIRVDRWFASSKTCSECEEVNPNVKMTNKTWTCPNCNAFHADRDFNAAVNIRREGLRLLESQIVEFQTTPGSGESDARGEGDYDPDENHDVASIDMGKILSEADEEEFNIF